MYVRDWRSHDDDYVSLGSDQIEKKTKQNKKPIFKFSFFFFLTWVLLLLLLFKKIRKSSLVFLFLNFCDDWNLNQFYLLRWRRLSAASSVAPWRSHTTQIQIGTILKKRLSIFGVFFKKKEKRKKKYGALTAHTIHTHTKRFFFLIFPLCWSSVRLDRLG